MSLQTTVYEGGYDSSQNQKSDKLGIQQMSEDEKQYENSLFKVNFYFSNLSSKLVQSNENLINKIHDISMIFKNIF